ncbi:hypothetical protein D9615_005099 [Tricholomella constricta]|uniref:Uncharacterized protein n=1 Tax=Tricholomella constricta TaxID=117010 RepID=A0A8H5H6E5_9AGAR|nr:hypothetical protein D9615_005099 [Tricholomella constricta]
MSRIAVHQKHLVKHSTLLSPRVQESGICALHMRRLLCVANLPSEHSHIILYGHSLGGVVALCLFSHLKDHAPHRRPESSPAPDSDSDEVVATDTDTDSARKIRIRGLILENPFASVPGMYPQRWSLVWDRARRGPPHRAGPSGTEDVGAGERVRRGRPLGDGRATRARCNAGKPLSQCIGGGGGGAEGGGDGDAIGRDPRRALPSKRQPALAILRSLTRAGRVLFMKPSSDLLGFGYSPNILPLAATTRYDVVTVLVSGQSVEVEHDLSEAYNFSKLERASNNLFYIVDSSNNAVPIYANADTHRAKLTGKVAVTRRAEAQS